MRPTFWKLSHGAKLFTYEEILEGLNQRLAFVYWDTSPRGKSKRGQGEDFMEAPIGDYFYLTHGNQGIYVLGQFTGPANFFSTRKLGWADRPYRVIRSSIDPAPYNGPKKQWTPNDDSTFTRVPDHELSAFEELILRPYFGIELTEFNIK